MKSDLQVIKIEVIYYAIYQKKTFYEQSGDKVSILFATI